MPTNDFQPFAVAGGANVVSQAQLLAASQRLTGFQSGVAPSNLMNKIWRQASFVSAALAQLAMDITQADVLDNGSLTTLEGILGTAASVGLHAVDTGATNSLVGAYAVPITTLVDGMVVSVKVIHTNTGASTFSMNGIAAAPIWTVQGLPLAGNEIPIGSTALLMWNSTMNGTGAWVLLNSTIGSVPLGGIVVIPNGTTIGPNISVTVATLTIPKTGIIAVGACVNATPNAVMLANTIGGLVIGILQNGAYIANSSAPIKLSSGEQLSLGAYAGSQWLPVTQGDVITVVAAVYSTGDTTTGWKTLMTAGSTIEDALTYHYIK